LGQVDSFRLANKIVSNNQINYPLATKSLFVPGQQFFNQEPLRYVDDEICNFFVSLNDFIPDVCCRG
jgi:hypothetical protein